MGIEQRQYPRLEQEFPVMFEVVPLTLSRPLVKPRYKGWAKNISGGGLYTLIPRISKRTIKKLLEHGLKLSIEFYLPDFQNRVKVLGEIRWARKKSKWWRVWSVLWALGVKFTYIQAEDKDCIIKYVINKQIEEHLLEKPSQ